MAKMLCAVAVVAFVVPAAALVTAQDSDCTNGNTVVFDKTDSDLHVRTMVVEDDDRQRMLVLVADNDTSMPCKPRWWLDHNPQGAIQCLGNASAVDTKTSACDAMQCKSDPTNVQLGYVRTMLASAIFVPQVHTISAICIELGCRSRIRK